MDKADRAQVLGTVSKCFATCERDEWDELTGCAAWAAFIEGCRYQFQKTSAKHAPLSEFMARCEVDALHNPPTYACKRAFAARHFTGGLPGSAMPVESLYRSQMNGASAENGAVAYGSPSAEYMADLVASMGFETPSAFAAYPDHLALETDLAAVLYRSGLPEADSFVAERFTWLTAYRMKLIGLNDADAWFYIGLVDVLVGMLSLTDGTAFEEDADSRGEASSETILREEMSCQKTL
jgi:TorA maturation chaperone TorD